MNFEGLFNLIEDIIFKYAIHMVFEFLNLCTYQQSM